MYSTVFFNSNIYKKKLYFYFMEAPTIIPSTRAEFSLENK